MSRLVTGFLLVVWVLGGACAVRQVPPLSAPPPREGFELNFAGVSTTTWEEDFRFYTETLGFRVHSLRDHWALFGAGWDDYVTGKSRGLVCELFEAPQATETQHAEAEPSRPLDQPIRLGIRVHDLGAMAASLRTRGVRFVGPGDSRGSTRRLGFTSPGGTRWMLWSDHGQPGRQSLSDPEIMTVELRVANPSRSAAFYRDVLGLRSFSTRDSELVMGQSIDGPRLILLSGGDHRSTRAIRGPDPALAQPHFLGFMTANVREAAEWVRSKGVRVVREVEHHDWGGTDLLIADPDGNVVQVYELDDPRRFGEEARPGSN